MTNPMIPITHVPASSLAIVELVVSCMLVIHNPVFAALVSIGAMEIFAGFVFFHPSGRLQSQILEVVDYGRNLSHDFKGRVHAGHQPAERLLESGRTW